jgi:hypothetical protein
MSCKTCPWTAAPSRTNWTRRVPQPVLIGHAVSLTPNTSMDSSSPCPQSRPSLAGQVAIASSYCAEFNVSIDSFLELLSDAENRRASSRPRPPSPFELNDYQDCADCAKST